MSPDRAVSLATRRGGPGTSPETPDGWLLGAESWDRRAPRWAAWLATGIAGAVAWTFLRAGIPNGVFPGCALREVFHVGCATCGLTRAMESLARGDVGASLAFHPLALLLAIEVGLAWLGWGAGLRRGRPWITGRIAARAAWLTAAAGLAVWLVRLATGTVPV
jgi:hypothetical protein